MSIVELIGVGIGTGLGLVPVMLAYELRARASRAMQVWIFAGLLCYLYGLGALMVFWLLDLPAPDRLVVAVIAALTAILAGLVQRRIRRKRET